MFSRILSATMAGLLLFPAFAGAHGIAGPRLFISTLIVDDPNVADEASLPTFFWLPQSTDPGTPAPQLYQLNIELDKRITENFGVSLASGYTWLTQPGGKTANGWQNLALGLKYKIYVNADHEFMLSAGVKRLFARTGANGSNGDVLGNNDTGSTAPVLYFGKGLGDLPIGFLRPLAITGTLSYQIADKKLKVTDPSPAFNNGTANQWAGGLSLQYSMRYLQAQVKDFGLPDVVNKLTAVAEMQWSSPASQPNKTATQYLFGVGVNYTATDYALTVEMLIPGNRQSGSHLGAIAQVHWYFDDLFPTGLGKPISRWGRS